MNVSAFQLVDGAEDDHGLHGGEGHHGREEARHGHEARAGLGGGERARGGVGEEEHRHRRQERGRADLGQLGRLLGIHYRGVQWEGGAVDGGSIT